MSRGGGGAVSDNAAEARTETIAHDTDQPSSYASGGQSACVRASSHANAASARANLVVSQRRRVVSADCHTVHWDMD